VALAATLATAAVSIPLSRSQSLGAAFSNLLVFALPHAALLAVLLARDIGRDTGCARIDALMLAALTFIAWFGLVPLLNLR
jgi:hypothetical protein